MNYIGDFPEDFASVTVLFTTHDGNGAPVAPSSGFEADDVKIYKNGNAAQKTTTNGLTMTSPFDSITGLHCLVIDTSVDTGDAGFWVAGATYSVVLNPDTETVNGQSVLKVVATFGLALAPVFARIGAPVGASIAADIAGVQADTDNIQTRLPTSLVSGRIDASVGAMANDVITSAAIAADAIGSAELAASAVTEIQSGLSTLDAAGVRAAVGLASANLDTQIGTLATASALATVAGYVDTEVAAIKAKTDNLPSDPADASDIAAAFTSLQSHGDSAWATATGFSTLDAAGVRSAVGMASANLDTQLDALPTTAEVNAEVDTALADAGVTSVRMAHLDADVSSRLASSSYTAPPSAATIAQAVWDALTSALTTVGSIGKLLVTNIDAAVSSRSIYAGGDTAGTTTLLSRLTSTRASNLDNLDAAVTTRLADASYIAPDNAGVAAIKAKTDDLTFTVSGKVDANITHVNETAVTGTGAGGDEWGPA
ncbi:hypothetical protein P9279_22105 [Mesorhizobium sp. WSM4962]|uniref:hypothetical protein n=1 Tax=Mesorhizobium sp. WSM4962 TaxID=3038548 RepID=UPI002417C401|nr:hypothetical protein [Mesorhizobium sp. WSM4962]MDG4903207.1 hypothetical protein [Mesorhizobium sp. WSM4962]